MAAVILDGILGAWLLGVTVGFFWLWGRFRRLMKNFSSENLKLMVDLNQLVGVLERNLTLNLQKIGLVRFNPFSGTGGDQSFSLALMDGTDNGVVITSLHHRESTRLYAKQIAAGKSVTHELSEEEKKAIKIAKKSGKGKNEK
ncbi:MAG: DUF4446 family protein [Candidatus Shapirobacteria bacterium]